MNDCIALLAGEGQMPVKVYEEMLQMQKKVLLIAVKGATAPSLIQRAQLKVIINFTQIGKAIKYCKQFGIKELVMVGRVSHQNIFSVSLLKLDLTTLLFWIGLKDKRADTILGALAHLLQKKGITLISSVKYLKRYLAKEGVLTHNKPTAKQMEDLFFGVKIAKEMGRLDIGQTVAIKHKSIVAIEAMEGTDACIERAGKIAGPSVVIVKMSKPTQDMRFDVPVIGLNTIEKLIKIEASLLAIEAEKTVILDPEAIALANKHNLVIMAIDPQETEKICALS